MADSMLLRKVCEETYQLLGKMTNDKLNGKKINNNDRYNYSQLRNKMENLRKLNGISAGEYMDIKMEFAKKYKIVC